MADEEPERFGPEVYRTRGLVVRPDPWASDRLEVVSRIGDMTITIKLSEFEARDLINQLESWRAGWPLPVGPAERG